MGQRPSKGPAEKALSDLAASKGNDGRKEKLPVLFWLERSGNGAKNQLPKGVSKLRQIEQGFRCGKGAHCEGDLNPE